MKFYPIHQAEPLSNGIHNTAYLNDFSLYLHYFNTIPNCVIEEEIRCRPANKWFESEYKDRVKNKHYNKRYLGAHNLFSFDDIYYILLDEIIVTFDINSFKVKFLFQDTNSALVDAIVKQIRRFRKRREINKPELLLILNTARGLDTHSMTLSKMSLSVADNYNDDFIPVHRTIIDRLSKSNDKGLIILHGKPGTGKTTYIRHLISCIQKKVIFLPPDLAAVITGPGLMSILIDNPNSVFVIEDAENIILDREKGGSSSVSALLNISDGLLSDCLNIQIICSFNTDIAKVDKALLRKGRLIAQYEFRELEITKSQNLSMKLGFKTTITSPMTLSAIYNQNEMEFSQEKKYNPIGFKPEVVS